MEDLNRLKIVLYEKNLTSKSFAPKFDKEIIVTVIKKFILGQSKGSLCFVLL